MAQPDYTDEQLAARVNARERFAPGTRVRHAYTGDWQGTIVKLHPGTVKRPRPVARWTATVQWDDSQRAPSRHALNLLRPIREAQR